MTRRDAAKSISMQRVHLFIKQVYLQEMLRAKHITMGQVARLEDAWKTNPAATLGMPAEQV